MGPAALACLAFLPATLIRDPCLALSVAPQRSPNLWVTSQRKHAASVSPDIKIPGRDSLGVNYREGGGGGWERRWKKRRQSDAGLAWEKALKNVVFPGMELSNMCEKMDIWERLREWGLKQGRKWHTRPKKKQNWIIWVQWITTIPKEGDLKEALIQPEGHGVEDLSYRIQSLMSCLS